jgi:hypothetical protein
VSPLEHLRCRDEEIFHKDVDQGKRGIKAHLGDVRVIRPKVHVLLGTRFVSFFGFVPFGTKFVPFSGTKFVPFGTHRDRLGANKMVFGIRPTLLT